MPQGSPSHMEKSPVAALVDVPAEQALSHPNPGTNMWVRSLQRTQPQSFEISSDLWVCPAKASAILEQTQPISAVLSLNSQSTEREKIITWWLFCAPEFERFVTWKRITEILSLPTTSVLYIYKSTLEILCCSIFKSLFYTFKHMYIFNF